MAEYKHRTCLSPVLDVAFDVLHRAGVEVENSGIYGCPGCGREVVIKRGQKLPEHCQPHLPEQGQVRWKLLVRAVMDK